MTLPLASVACPEQKTPAPTGTDVKVFVVGFHSLACAVGSSQASHMRISPVLSNVACTETSGQSVSGPHSPTWARASVFATVTSTPADVVADVIRAVDAKSV